MAESLVKCTAFQVDERIDSDNFKSIATITIERGYKGALDIKGVYVKGQYNARTNTFHPTILGDDEALEDYYDDIQTAVEGRSL